MNEPVSPIIREIAKLASYTRVASIAFSILVISGCATTETQKEPEPIKASLNVKEVVALIQIGRYEEAKNRYILPTISEFEKTYGTSSKAIYSAQSSAESLLYMLLSAANKKDAIVIGPQFAEAYFLNGYILVEKHQTVEAKQNLQKAIDLAPSRAHYISELANIYQSEGNFKKAIELFDRAIEGASTLEIDDKIAVELRRAYRGKAFSLTELGQYDEAESLYRKCLELFSNDEKAKHEIGYIKNIRLKNTINKGKY